MMGNVYLLRNLHNTPVQENKKSERKAAKT